MKSAAIYCRVSTEDQEREGTSLISQREACLAKAKELGYEVPQDCVILETCSGLALDRPKLIELRQWVRAKEVEAVIAYTLDRVSRDPVHFIILQEEMEKASVNLILVTETLDSSDMGKLISHIKGYAAKLEAEKIRERTMRGIRERVKAGKLPSGQRGQLYGYTYSDGKRHVNETTANTVRDIFNWLIEGETLNGITYRLRALGICPPSGNGYWIRSTVYKILTNISYTGKTYVYIQTHKVDKETKRTVIETKPYSEGVEIPNATPAIIPAELFNQAQAILKRNKEQSRRNGKITYLLRGHIICSYCGRKYWGYARAGTGQRYYYCMGRRSIITPVKCDNTGYNADQIETLVWRRIEALLSQPDTIFDGIRARQEELNSQVLIENEIETIINQLANRERQKDRVCKTFYIVGDEDRLRRDIATLDSEVKSLKKRQAELEERIKANEEFDFDVAGIKQSCQVVRDNLKTLSFEDKRLALEALAIQVRVDGENIAIHGAIPVCDIKSILPCWKR